MTGQADGPAAARASRSPACPASPRSAPGDDLAGLIADAAPDLADGDIVVVTSKIVSKAEGRVVRADREQAIDAETVRVVARRGADPDRGDPAGPGARRGRGGRLQHRRRARWCCCPRTRTARPAGSATALRDRLGVTVGGGHHRHPGPAVADGPDRRGDRRRRAGPAARLPRPAGHVRHPLEVTVAAVADEIAAAADLVKGKAGRHPRGAWSGAWRTWSPRPTAPARRR